MVEVVKDTAYEIVRLSEVAGNPDFPRFDRLLARARLENLSPEVISMAHDFVKDPWWKHG